MGEPLKILVVNVHFHPVSYGGATIIAENLVRHLAPHANVAVVTTWSSEAAQPYDLVRYEAFGIPVFAIRVPQDGAPALNYRNPDIAPVFGEVLDAFAPDIVHLHSIQDLSASVAEACQLAGIPYVVTLHDAWWLCERQFMIDKDDHACRQTEIEPGVCAQCMPDIQYTRTRTRYLRKVLERASLILTPSEFQRKLYLANGCRANQIKVNRNGVAAPREGSARDGSNNIRFGFVGGVGPAKGLDLIHETFGRLASSSYELVLVDNSMTIGHSTMEWRGPAPAGRVTIIPAYRPEDVDDFFDKIDVLLCPSQNESFGLAVREALVRDKWVIATNAGAGAEDIVDGVNGTIIPVGDAGALTNAVEQVLKSPEKLRGYRNIHKKQIATSEDQARELYKYLTAALPQSSP